MRNKYEGPCYYCGLIVKPKQGHFERYNGKWRLIHSECVFKQRKEKQKLKKINE